ncbi:nucleoid-associated protein [Longimicrobium sp.]|uniref:nucleoid-associated protein n=1 Tax=Longimicrobium sp. TaxID=2029185 RepID=UPI002E31C18A|nr:nucleoid-associated protein [Longimicrobium sp.]HEX6038139.1 nucleoid-associated protein [Longimicrobium sp.]
MALISKEESALLDIDDFIFHVVHQGGAEPQLLDATPLGGFKEFFLERVKETLRGNRFVFLPDSATMERLRQVAHDHTAFVSVSKELAREFHTRQDKRIKPGVFIFMRLSAGARSFFSLLKYDNEQVLMYEVDQAQAILTEITRSFTKNTKALQKSALVELTADNAEIVVVDKTVRTDITDFFRNFLGVKRRFTNAEMTVQVQKAVLDTVVTHAGELPVEITSHVHERFLEIVEQRDEFDAPQFVAEYFGPHGSDAVEKSFTRILDRRGLGGEAFPFEREAALTVETQKYRTIEGVSIQIKEQAKSTVQITQDNDMTTVTIRTRRLLPQ